ncbi:TetR/AcrR family transcriptional regulator [Planomonospora sp. ID91781]|uniref:TetR family transcriptional regulator n=2 Tax=Planomonospora parontospora TaxID=58119 RepID=A0AA37F4V5_9ACTN|nr:MULTISPECIES: TetR/AcrR family transcriptional regulator [Planomonospora]MBG0819399.1 TetR/AcrR family transcriptional regulator [Planomonospora sp. ID91781]GGK70438.1 TetR family transcriptional regulator [Planomonospora parontospora]GII09813.1 TetR family transcriptional regulator [Planomonospora parontospora subsp. parontospora]GII17014.1 TetR family transcriptional regulator [Planomonospora parontospora subsp. antibiotica]
MSTSPSPRGRRPDPAVDAKIRAAVLELLLQRGLEMTMDEVAAHAGVGRASVFRRYPTKRDLLLDALTQVLDVQVAIPDTGSLAGDLRQVVADTLAVWRDDRLAALSRQVLGETGRDPVVADLVRTSMRDRMARSWVVYERAIERGELRPDGDLWLLTDLFAGLVAYRGLLGLDLPDPDEVVRSLLHGFATTG